MTIGPLLPGRIPNSLTTTHIQKQLSTHEQTLQRLRDQLSSGQRLIVPSDDPTAAIRTVSMQKLLEQNRQVASNLTTSQSLLAAGEDSLGQVSNVFDAVKSMILQGVGENSTSQERAQFAQESSILLQQVANVGNTQFRGRYLFAGATAETAPFSFSDKGIRFEGSLVDIQSFVGTDDLVANNIRGDVAFNPLVSVESADLNPALTFESTIAGLRGGKGVTLGEITVAVDDGTTVETRSVDLRGSVTANDIKLRIEAAFAGTPTHAVTVGIDPGSASALRITTAGTTVSIADVSGGSAARDLGIRSPAVAQITGDDLNPKLSRLTPISALRGGLGLTGTAGTGLQLNIGGDVVTVDVDGLATVEDLLNRIQAASPDVVATLGSSGSSLVVSSRFGGATFSIGENGGTIAQQLGLRTLSGSTSLSQLNLGAGFPQEVSPNLELTRRNGSVVQIDLAGVETFQDVLDAINAVDPGHLTASFVATGNGLTITDDSGTGPLLVTQSAISSALGLPASEPGTDPLVPLVGADVTARTSGGIVGLLGQLQHAFVNEDNAALAQLDKLFNQEQERFNLVRGEVGIRLQSLDQLSSYTADSAVHIQETLAADFEIDFTKVVTDLATTQNLVQASQQIAAQTLQQSLFSFL